MTDNDLKNELAAIRIRVDGLPIIGVAIETLQQNVRMVQSDVRTLHTDTRMIRAAINDMARTEITAGEVEALHADVNRVLEKQSEMERRLTELEAKQ